MNPDPQTRGQTLHTRLARRFGQVSVAGFEMLLLAILLVIVSALLVDGSAGLGTKQVVAIVLVLVALVLVALAGLFFLVAFVTWVTKRR